jgi:hypothetical protein
MSGLRPFYEESQAIYLLGCADFFRRGITEVARFTLVK